MKELSPAKENLVLLNKADLLGQEQRSAWARFFEGDGVRVVFWSALAEGRRLAAGLKVTLGVRGAGAGQAAAMQACVCWLPFWPFSQRGPPPGGTCAGAVSGGLAAAADPATESSLRRRCCRASRLPRGQLACAWPPQSSCSNAAAGRLVAAAYPGEWGAPPGGWLPHGYFALGPVVPEAPPGLMVRWSRGIQASLGRAPC